MRVMRSRPAVEKNSDVIVGVDPGCSGALVAIDENGRFIDALLMPVVTSGTNTRVNGAAVAAWLHQHCVTHAFIEKVGSMPKQGVASTFTFGHAAGLVEGVVAGAGIPITHLTPQRWKKEAGLIGSEKDAARSRAIQLYPGLRLLDAKAKGQAIADALLIARAGFGLPVNEK
jgi:crossover junction endodeoxyribonuclease RuvC